mgnify:FL=1
MPRADYTCADCGCDLTYETRYELNGSIYCCDCAEAAADDDWQDLTVQEKIISLGGEIYHY